MNQSEREAKIPTAAKRGKMNVSDTSNQLELSAKERCRCQARESTQHATCVKRGKTRNGWQVRKISVSWVTISGSFATDWLETNEQKLGFL